MNIYRMANIKTGEIHEGTVAEICELVEVTEGAVRNSCRNRKLITRTWKVEIIEDSAKLHEHYVRLGLYRTCIVCGNEFLADKFAKICCSVKCSEVRRRDVAGNYHNDKPRPVKKALVETLASIEAKAKAAGMSYGQYVSLMGL